MQSGFRDIELSHLEANDPATGYVLGFAGPIFSLTIGAFCLLSAVILGWSPEMHGADPPTSALAAIVWLGVLNVVWAIFNFIPVSPFDGGRVFRAMVWMRSHKKARSKRLAVHISQFIATFFLVWGAFQILGGGLNGLWLLLIGAISLTSARGAYESPRDVKIISPLRVDDLMQRDCEIVHGQMDLQVFVNEHLLRTGNQYYFVAENDRLAGMITPAEVMLMRHARLTNKTVGQVMCTLDDFQIVAPQMPIAKVYETMMMAEVDQLPVASDNQLIGIITRDDILRNSYTHFISEN
ncbi:MAG: CBS domain-containing protein [Acidobacteriota bacterium]